MGEIRLWFFIKNPWWSLISQTLLHYSFWLQGKSLTCLELNWKKRQEIAEIHHFFRPTTLQSLRGNYHSIPNLNSIHRKIWTYLGILPFLGNRRKNNYHDKISRLNACFVTLTRTPFKYWLNCRHYWFQMMAPFFTCVSDLQPQVHHHH